MNQRERLTTEILEVPWQKCPLSLAFDCELLLRAKIRTMAHHCNFPGMNSDMRSNNVKMFHSHMILCRFHQRVPFCIRASKLHCHTKCDPTGERHNLCAVTFGTDILYLRETTFGMSIDITKREHRIIGRIVALDNVLWYITVTFSFDGKR